MYVAIKQHLSDIGSSIHEEVKQHWGWVEKKSVAYIKSVYVNCQQKIGYLPPYIYRNNFFGGYLSSELPVKNARTHSFPRWTSQYRTLLVSQQCTLSPSRLLTGDHIRFFHGKSYQFKKYISEKNTACGGIRFYPVWIEFKKNWNHRSKSLVSSKKCVFYRWVQTTYFALGRINIMIYS